MTGPCSGAGVGIAKPGFAALQYIAPAAIGGALAGLSGWGGFAVGASIGALTYDLTTFCPNGPPAMPTFTEGDIAALASFVPLPGFAAANQKLADLVGNLFWPTLCDCTSGTSTLGPPSTYPAGAPQTTPSPATTPVCLQVDMPVQSIPHQNAVPNCWLRGSVSTTTDDLPVPNGAQYMTVTISMQAAGATHTDMLWSVQCRDVNHNALGANVGGDVAAPGAPGGGPTTQTISVALSPGTVYLRSNITPSNAAATDTFSAQLRVYCSGLPGQTTAPCCEPDPQTQALLERILGMVTLIQRQAAPMSYVYGANHTGLTGHGSFAVSQLLGVSVDVTTIPSWGGRIDGSPVEYFDLGFVTLGTADGYDVSRRIDHDGSLVLPQSAGAFTAVGYTLEPGVVVSIRELVREP